MNPLATTGTSFAVFITGALLIGYAVLLGKRLLVALAERTWFLASLRAISSLILAVKF